MRLFRRGEDASTLDLLVAGLGNPGREYARTRHNVGWMVVDELARRHGGSWRSKFSGQLAEVRLDGARLALLKPETYMNESGRSISAPRSSSRRPSSPCSSSTTTSTSRRAASRRALGGGLGRPQRPALDRVRARLTGLPAAADRVGRPGRGDRRSVADYVLAPFEPETDVDALVARAADAVETIVRDGLEAAQQRFN